MEDNLENLRLVEHIVKRQSNLKLICAETAEDGISMAQQYRPDLVILDIHLPGMNGYQALAKLSQLKETKEIKVLALSAAVNPRDIEKGLLAGFKRYLTKPIDVLDFLDVINTELELKGA